MDVQLRFPMEFDFCDVWCVVLPDLTLQSHREIDGRLLVL